MPYLRNHSLINNTAHPIAFRDDTSHKKASPLPGQTQEQHRIMARVYLTSTTARRSDGGEKNATHEMLESADAAQRSEYRTIRRLRLAI